VSSGDRGQWVPGRLERGRMTLWDASFTTGQRLYEGSLASGVSLEWSSVVSTTDGVRRNIRRRQVSLDGK